MIASGFDVEILMKKKYLVSALLLLAVATVQFVTMPAFFYPGDNFAMRAETANWVNTGNLGIDYSQRAELGGMLTERGQYFYENDEKQLFFSRYGIGDTVLFLPPYAVYKAIYGSVPLMGTPNELLFILNCYSVLFATASTLFLYLIAGLLTSTLWIRIAFTLASLYATFCAHYLKQPQHENFQIALSLVFFYFALRFFLYEGERKPWWSVGVACFAAGALVTTKSSFVLYYVALGLAVLIDGFSKHGKNFKGVLWKPMGKYILWIGVPAMLALVVLLISNTVRFGSPSDSGYGQWMRNGTKTDYFSLSLLKKTLPLFLWKPGNHNIFLHYPLFIAAIPGFFFLYRKNRASFWLLIISSVIYFFPIASYSGWAGGWCYGPRHLIFILMSGSIASICLFEKISQLKPAQKWTILSTCAGVAAYSAFLTFQVNTIQCFAIYQLSGIFKQINRPAITKYFTEYTTRGLIYRDIHLHAKGKKEFPPIQEISRLPGSQQACKQLDQAVNYFGRPNYYFFSKDN